MYAPPSLSLPLLLQPLSGGNGWVLEESHTEKEKKSHGREQQRERKPQQHGRSKSRAAGMLPVHASSGKQGSSSEPQRTLPTALHVLERLINALLSLLPLLMLLLLVLLVLLAVLSLGVLLLLAGVPYPLIRYEQPFIQQVLSSTPFFPSSSSTSSFASSSSHSLCPVCHAFLLNAAVNNFKAWNLPPCCVPHVARYVSSGAYHVDHSAAITAAAAFFRVPLGDGLSHATGGWERKGGGGEVAVGVQVGSVLGRKGGEGKGVGAFDRGDSEGAWVWGEGQPASRGVSGRLSWEPSRRQSQEGGSGNGKTEGGEGWEDVRRWQQKRQEVVVFDIDETLLSNLPYLQAHGYGSEPYNSSLWADWVLTSSAPPLPAGIALVRALQQTTASMRDDDGLGKERHGEERREDGVGAGGLGVALVTSRLESQRAATVENLRRPDRPPILLFSGSTWSQLSRSQIIYLLVVQGVGSAILDAGANFGIATAMYRGSPDPVRVWELPNSLAGDAIVTIMIQGTLTWVIAGLLTRLDVKSERIQPIFYQHAPRPLQDFPADGSASGAVTPPPGETTAAAADADRNSTKAPEGSLSPAKPTSSHSGGMWGCFLFLDSVIRWILCRGDFDFVVYKPKPGPHRFLRFVHSVLRGAMCSALIAIPYWPLCLVPLLALWHGNVDIPDWPGPQIFKAVMAAVLGFFMTPLVSMVGLLEAGRCSLSDLQQI
ncbi:unnamed protein product [Closterium sp. NIES-53]